MYVWYSYNTYNSGPNESLVGPTRRVPLSCSEKEVCSGFTSSITYDKDGEMKKKNSQRGLTEPCPHVNHRKAGGKKDELSTLPYLF